MLTVYGKDLLIFVANFVQTTVVIIYGLIAILALTPENKFRVHRKTESEINP